MRIVIAGAGEVGTHLAKLLSREDMEISLLDEYQEPETDYDKGKFRRLIERIAALENHLEFEFKCGLETEIQM